MPRTRNRFHTLEETQTYLLRHSGGDELWSFFNDPSNSDTLKSTRYKSFVTGHEFAVLPIYVTRYVLARLRQMLRSQLQDLNDAQLRMTFSEPTQVNFPGGVSETLYISRFLSNSVDLLCDTIAAIEAAKDQHPNSPATVNEATRAIVKSMTKARKEAMQNPRIAKQFAKLSKDVNGQWSYKQARKSWAQVDKANSLRLIDTRLAELNKQHFLGKEGCRLQKKFEKLQGTLQEINQQIQEKLSQSSYHFHTAILPNKVNLEGILEALNNIDLFNPPPSDHAFNYCWNKADYREVFPTANPEDCPLSKKQNRWCKTQIAAINKCLAQLRKVFNQFNCAVHDAVTPRNTSDDSVNSDALTSEIAHLTTLRKQVEDFSVTTIKEAEASSVTALDDDDADWLLQGEDSMDRAMENLSSAGAGAHTTCTTTTLLSSVAGDTADSETTATTTITETYDSPVRRCLSGENGSASSRDRPQLAVPSRSSCSN